MYRQISGASAATASALLLVSVGLTAQAGDFTLGAGVSRFESPYTGFNDKDGGFIFAEYEGDSFSIGSGGLSYLLMGDETSPLSLYVSLSSVGSGFDSGDSTAFTGMAERDSSIDLGAGLDYRLGDGSIGASLFHDVSGTHKGFVADLNYSHPIELGNSASLTPMLGLSYNSDDYNDYYYGVRASEATISRAVYKADGGTSPYIGYELQVPLSEHWSLIHSAQYTWLSSEIKDSSITDRDNSWAVSLGTAYRF